MKNPYENNEYLKDDKEVLKEMLFFKKFGLPMEDTSNKKDKNDNEEEKEQEI